MKTTEIKQVQYPTLELDNSEKDIIEIWQKGETEFNLIQVERENIKTLIDLLNQL